MKKIKDITLSIFAIIGFISIISAFNTQPQQETHGTPESHVWEFHISVGATSPSFAINKVTGEVRKYNSGNFSLKKDGTLSDIVAKSYSSMTNEL